MEQNTNNDPSNTSPPTKNTKLQLEEQLPPSETTSNQTASTAANLNAANLAHNQKPSNVANTENLHQFHNGILNPISPRSKTLLGPLRRILIQTQPTQ